MKNFKGNMPIDNNKKSVEQVVNDKIVSQAAFAIKLLVGTNILKRAQTYFPGTNEDIQQEIEQEIIDLKNELEALRSDLTSVREKIHNINSNISYSSSVVEKLRAELGKIKKNPINDRLIREKNTELQTALKRQEDANKGLEELIDLEKDEKQIRANIKSAEEDLAQITGKVYSKERKTKVEIKPETSESLVLEFAPPRDRIEEIAVEFEKSASTSELVKNLENYFKIIYEEYREDYIDKIAKIFGSSRLIREIYNKAVYERPETEFTESGQKGAEPQVSGISGGTTITSSYLASIMSLKKIAAGIKINAADRFVLDELKAKEVIKDLLKNNDDVRGQVVRAVSNMDKYGIIIGERKRKLFNDVARKVFKEMFLPTKSKVPAGGVDSVFLEETVNEIFRQNKWLLEKKKEREEAFFVETPAEKPKGAFITTVPMPDFNTEFGKTVVDYLFYLVKTNKDQVVAAAEKTFEKEENKEILKSKLSSDIDSNIKSFKVLKHVLPILPKEPNESLKKVLSAMLQNIHNERTLSGSKIWTARNTIKTAALSDDEKRRKVEELQKKHTEKEKNIIVACVVKLSDNPTSMTNDPMSVTGVFDIILSSDTASQMVVKTLVTMNLKNQNSAEGATFAFGQVASGTESFAATKIDVIVSDLIKSGLDPEMDYEKIYEIVAKRTESDKVLSEKFVDKETGLLDEDVFSAALKESANSFKSPEASKISESFMKYVGILKGKKG